VATERTIKHPDGRVERVSENSTGPTIVEQRRSGGGMSDRMVAVVTCHEGWGWY
jgi:hypothetical protein